MNKSKTFSPEVRERAAQMVQEHCGEYPLLWPHAVDRTDDRLRAANLAGLGPAQCWRAA